MYSSLVTFERCNPRENCEEQINGQPFEFVVNNYHSSFHPRSNDVLKMMKQTKICKMMLCPNLIFSHFFVYYFSLRLSIFSVFLKLATSQAENIKRDFMKIICALASIIRLFSFCRSFFNLLYYAISFCLVQGMTLHTKARLRLPFSDE